MGIRYTKKHASLEGVVTVEEAEGLLGWLRTQSSPAVHLGRCDHLHAAVLQVLLAVRPRVVRAPADVRLAVALGSAEGARTR